MKRKLKPWTSVGYFLGGSALLVLYSGAASAVQIETGNDDINVRWDNTVRYNGGWRMQEPRADLIAPGSGAAASNARFKKNSMVTNRVDLLSEFDVVYKNESGFRVSGAGWYDAVYNNHTLAGVPGSTFGPYPNNQLPDDVQRYYNGPSGEFLDAFIFHKFNIGDTAVNVRLGQHTIYWGETLFSLANGVAAGQSPADLRKALATPGVEAKEVFLPLPQLSFSAQVSPELTVMGQYYFDYKIDRFPLGGTYYSPVDFLTYTGHTNVAPGAINWNGENFNGRKKRGDWGLAAKWSPAWLDGTAGFYYREYTPKNSGVLAVDATNSIFAGGVNPANAQIFLDPAAPRTKLFGVSLSKLLHGVSFGMDLTYRKDTNLATKPFTIIGGPYNPLTGWATLGDVVTGTFSGIKYISKTALFDSAVLTAEIAFDHRIKVTKNAQNYGDEAHCVTGTGPLNAGAPNQGYYGCATKGSVGLSLAFTPVWFQALQGVDISMPMYVGYGLHGNSVVPSLGMNKGMGSYTIGVSANVKETATIALAYNGQLYQRRINSATGVPFSNASLGDFSDRNSLSLTVKTTF